MGDLAAVEIELGGGRRRRSSRSLRFMLILVLLGGLAVGGWVSLRVGEPPVVKMSSDLPAIGKKTTVAIDVAEPKRGLTTVLVELVQGDRTEKLAEETFTPQPPHMLWAPKTDQHHLEVVVGRSTIEGLQQGEASIRVTAGRAGTWLEHPDPVVETLTLPVRITPPTIELLSSQTYVTQGGSEVVVYKVGDSAVTHGVRAKDWVFRGFDLPGGKAGEKFALFAVPYDVDDSAEVKLFTEDDVGNDVSIGFIDHFNPKPFKTDSINVSDGFMKKVVPRIMGQTPSFRDRGSLLDNYVAINSDMRKQNADRLVALAKDSEEKFFWNKVFLQMPAKVVSSFADRRTYFYESKEIDRQDHLGFDLASTAKAPIPAANAGKVILAEYFGIYGNAVVIDHGFGLMSLYGHMSKIDVEVGQVVDRGHVIGTTGATGLALGDHLHFTMLLHGLPVTPIEWWDAQWIKNRVATKLGDTLGYVEE